MTFLLILLCNLISNWTLHYPFSSCYRAFTKRNLRTFFFKITKIDDFSLISVLQGNFFSFTFKSLYVFFYSYIERSGFFSLFVFRQHFICMGSIEAFRKYFFLLMVVYFEALNWDNFVRKAERFMNIKENAGWVFSSFLIKCFPFLRTEFWMYL